MFPALTLNSGRSAAIEAFRRLRLRDQAGLFWSTLRARSRCLKDFSALACPGRDGRKHLGWQDVPVEQITGSLNRSRDFDSSFRPLKKHLRDRWVAIYLLVGVGALEPVRLHKVGPDYYVEDGHHRVSVARQRGMACVRAEVWEYAPKPCGHELACPQRGRWPRIRRLRAVPACG